MKRILLSLWFYCICFVGYSQSTESSIKKSFDEVMSAIEVDNYKMAKSHYDAAIALLQESPNSTYALSYLTIDIVDYITRPLFANDVNNAKQYIDTAMNLLESSVIQYAKENESFAKAKDDVVARLEMLNSFAMLYLEADQYSQAQDLYNRTIQISREEGILTENLAEAYEVLGYIASHYHGDYLGELNNLYTTFKVFVNLYSAESEEANRAYQNLVQHYALDIAYLSFLGNQALVSMYPNLPRIAPDEMAAIINRWIEIRDDIKSTVGESSFALLSNAVNEKIGLNGDSRILTDSEETALLYLSLLCIDHNHIEDFLITAEILLNKLSSPELLVVYSDEIVNSLKNHNYINVLYNYLSSLLKAEQFQSGKYREYFINQLCTTAIFFGDRETVITYMAPLINAIEKGQDYPYDDTIEFVKSLNNIYSALPRTETNEYILRRCNEIAIQLIEDIIPTVTDPGMKVDLYQYQSIHYSALGNYTKAKEALQNQNLFQIERARLLGEDASLPSSMMWPARGYLWLADILASEKDYTTSIEYLLNCEKHFLQYEPNTSTLSEVYDLLMYDYIHLNKMELAENASRRQFNHILNLYYSNTKGMTKIQRTDYWQRLNNGKMQVNCQFALESDAFIGLAYDMALIQKGFLLKHNQTITENIKSSSDKDLIEAYSDFLSAISSNNPNKDFYEERMMSLYSIHPEYTQANEIVKWQDVQKQLKKDDLAIEFVRCCNDGENTTYAALLLKNSWNTPKIVSLCSGEELDNAFQEGAKAYRNMPYLFSLVWKPIIPFLSGVKRIYFSPDGVLSQMNIEVLADEKGNEINKKYDLARVSSTAQLAVLSNNHKINASTLYGGLTYDSELPVQSVSEERIAFVSSISEELNMLDATTRKGWNYLAGTLKEVNAIENLLLNKKIDCKVYRSSSGTEESFKSMSGKSSSIIHIATHGFYLGVKDAARSNVHIISQSTGSFRSFPLKRCGLIMSGGQHAWLNEAIPTNTEDGILTGEEITGLDLTGTDLLVLSACQTGLGEIAGDGVYGLQRAFKIAGVKTIIMSLWEVNDSATELMMTKFYTSLASGKSKRDSFDAAITEVKREFEGPEYWAAFIMLD